MQASDEFGWRQVLVHVAFACACGVICGVASIVLCLCVHWSYDLFLKAQWLIWLLPVIGVLELLLYSWWKIPIDMTTDRLLENMRVGRNVKPQLAPGILVSTCMTMIAGGSVGQESGAMQMGASLGSLVAQPFRVRSFGHENIAAEQSTQRFTASTGMAAAFAALFFAPIGSCLMVLELMRFTVVRYMPDIILACFVAFSISRWVGIGGVITHVAVPHYSWSILGACIIIGVSAALGGSICATLIRVIRDLSVRIMRNLYVWIVIGGIAFAILVTSCNWYGLTGSGNALLNATLSGSNTSFNFFAKAVLTVICLGFWFKGGEIMPTLCIGGLLGSACTVMTGSDFRFGAALGAMCFLAAFNRCPLGAFFTGCEIFGWHMAPFLAVGVFVAFTFGYPVGIYGAGIDLLVRTRWSDFTERIHLNERDNERRGARGPYDNLAQMSMVLRSYRVVHRVEARRNVMHKKDQAHRKQH